MLGEPQAWSEVSLEAHLRATARALRMLVWRAWEWRARSSIVPAWSLVLAGLAHDSGKAWEGYQKKLAGKNPSFWGHEIISSLPLIFLYDIAEKLSGDYEEQKRGLIVACIAVLNHHHGMSRRFPERFYKPERLESIAEKIAKNYDSSLSSLWRSIPRTLEMIVELARKEKEEILTSLHPLTKEARNRKTFSIDAAEELLKKASRDKSLAAACTVATGFLSLADTIVASLERNRFDISKVMKRYAGRVLEEMMGKKKALERLQEVSSLIKPLYNASSPEQSVGRG